MTKREKILSGIIVLLCVGILAVGYKAYNYRKVLIEKKKIIAQKDENFLKGMKLSYEAYTRLQLVDIMRTYGIRHPLSSSVSQVEFQTALTKTSESNQKYSNFLEENGFKDGKLSNLINKENPDFFTIQDKYQSFAKILDEEDAKSKKE
ncbi:hypothetical protein JCM16774_0326 [Pseudoleptotrichia goodfellowii]|uniref:Uncharacterized protein n=2 Tax=Pseudoleptotrichia goodfellowii TaxID=157692 RepID=A0A510J8C4_9FUSO|nr:hypothetical protein [Pseudoleptotrichia goodfellowii]BBM35414.1 hypothetical protein JCM16774_0326 [Pseudoleptotrichia goodfellowii]